MIRQGTYDSGKLETQRFGYLKRVVHGCLKARCGKSPLKPAVVSVRVTSPGEVLVCKGRQCVIELSKNCTVSCIEGIAWVTFPGRFCDYIIHQGESLSLRGTGKVVVSGALEEVRLKVGQS